MGEGQREISYFDIRSFVSAIRTSPATLGSPGAGLLKPKLGLAALTREIFETTVARTTKAEQGIGKDA